jgi:hypothetical protein
MRPAVVAMDQSPRPDGVLELAGQGLLTVLHAGPWRLYRLLPTGGSSCAVGGNGVCLTSTDSPQLTALQMDAKSLLQAS